MYFTWLLRLQRLSSLPLLPYPQRAMKLWCVVCVCVSSAHTQVRTQAIEVPFYASKKNVENWRRAPCLCYGAVVDDVVFMCVCAYPFSSFLICFCACVRFYSKRKAKATRAPMHLLALFFFGVSVVCLLDVVLIPSSDVCFFVVIESGSG